MNHTNAALIWFSGFLANCAGLLAFVYRDDAWMLFAIVSIIFLLLGMYDPAAAAAGRTPVHNPEEKPRE